jgi:hypothetical protein
MSHRSGHTSGKAHARDLRLLFLGILLFITGVGLSTCEPLEDALHSSPPVGVGLRHPSGSEQS